MTFTVGWFVSLAGPNFSKLITVVIRAVALVSHCSHYNINTLL